MNMNGSTTVETTAPSWFMNGKTFEFNGPFERKEGHVTTDDLPGHLLAAGIYGALGASMLILALVRARENNSCRDFAGQYLPERSPTVLTNLGTSMIVICTLGSIQHAIVGALQCDSHSIFCFFGHIVMYFSYVLVGLTARWEAKGKLPPDSFRVVLAIVFLMNGYMLEEHAVMKEQPQDAKFHAIWGKLNIVNGAVLAFSVYNPKSVTAFVVSWAIPIWTGLWLTTIGVWACCWDVEDHMIGTWLGMELFVLVLVILLVVVFFVPKPEDSVEYASLTAAADYGKDDDGSSNEWNNSSN